MEVVARRVVALGVLLAVCTLWSLCMVPVPYQAVHHTQVEARSILRHLAHWHDDPHLQQPARRLLNPSRHATDSSRAQLAPSSATWLTTEWHWQWSDTCSAGPIRVYVQRAWPRIQKTAAPVLHGQKPQQKPAMQPQQQDTPPRHSSTDASFRSGTAGETALRLQHQAPLQQVQPEAGLESSPGPDVQPQLPQIAGVASAGWGKRLPVASSRQHLGSQMQRRLASSSSMEPAGDLLQGLQAEANNERLTLAAPPLLLPRQQLQQRRASRQRALAAPPAPTAPGMSMGAAGPAAAGSNEELPLAALDDSSSLLQDPAGNGTASTRLGKITSVSKGKRNDTAGSGGGIANNDYVPVEQRVILGALAGTVGDYFANIYIGQADIAIADPTIAAAAAAVNAGNYLYYYQDLDYEVFLGNAAFGPSAKATAGVVARIPGQVGVKAAGRAQARVIGAYSKNGFNFNARTASLTASAIAQGSAGLFLNTNRRSINPFLIAAPTEGLGIGDKRRAA